MVISPSSFLWLISRVYKSRLRLLLHVDSFYGVDEDGPVPTDDNSMVHIPECSYILSDTNFALLLRSMEWIYMNRLCIFSTTSSLH